MKYGSAKQNIILAVALLLIMGAVGASLYYALHRYLGLTLMFAVAAICLSAVCWNYMSVLELRYQITQHHDAIHRLTHHVDQRVEPDVADQLTLQLRNLRSSLEAANGAPSAESAPPLPIVPAEGTSDPLDSADCQDAAGEVLGSIASQEESDDSGERAEEDDETLAAIREQRGRLRREFAEAMKQGEFASALAIGDEITTIFPDSMMAEQFLQIRPQLLDRLHVTAGDQGDRIEEDAQLIAAT